MIERRAIKRGAAALLHHGGALSAWRRAASGIDLMVHAAGLDERLQRGGLVYMYHQLSERPNPFRPCADAREFEWFCGHLAQHYEVISLNEMEARRTAGRSLARAVALTFDDGYTDNLELGLPILRRYGLPATIFITTGTIGGASLLWSSRVSYLMEHGRVAGGQTVRACGVELALGSEQERVQSLELIYERLKRVEDVEREETIARLAEELGVPDFSGLAGDTLTWDQVRELDAAGFRAGGHTVTHPILGLTSDRQLEEEICGCKEELEGQLGHPVDTFAYPNGTPADYDQRAMDAISRAGFRAAYTFVYGANTRSTDPMQLLRVSAYGDTYPELALQMERFFYARTDTGL